MFKKEIRNFLGNLHDLRHFVELVGPFLNTHSSEVLRSRGKYVLPLLLAFEAIDLIPLEPDLKKRIHDLFGGRIRVTPTKDSETGKRVSVDIIGKDSKLFEAAVHDYFTELRPLRLLHQSSLTTLTSTVGWFMAQILHIYFAEYPGAIDASAKSLSLEDVRRFSSAKDAEDYLIAQKVETIMYGSFGSWIKFFKENPKLSMSYLDQHMDLLVETFERRNIIVHNGGVVNSIYLSKISPSLAKGPSLGEPILTDQSYLDERIDLFELDCLLICAELWKKIKPNDENRGKLLVGVALEHLRRSRWSICEGLGHFIMEDKQIPESQQLDAKLIYWLSLKRQGKWDSIKDEVEKMDLSAKDDRFKLAWLCLCQRNDNFFRLLPRVLRSRKIHKKELNTSPVFEDIRTDKRFDKYRTADEKKSRPDQKERKLKKNNNS